jgi:hypothetical protein
MVFCRGKMALAGAAQMLPGPTLVSADVDRRINERQ